MSELSNLFMLLVAVTIVLALIGVLSPRQLWLKTVAFGLSVTFVPLAYASLVDLLSRPKPVSLEWWQSDAAEATVLGSQISEDNAIHLWLQLPGVSEPRGYVLPWNRQLAKHLQDAQREAEEQGGDLRMRLPFEPSLDTLEPKFYAQPQPALPPKDYAQDPPQWVTRDQIPGDDI